MKQSFRSVRAIRSTIIPTLFAVLAFLVCDQGGSSASTERRRFAGTASAGALSLGRGCHSEDPERICLGLKYVSYIDEKGVPVASEGDAVANLRAINSVWASCNIQFQIDQYVAAHPADFGLRMHTGGYRELDRIRSAFADESMLLVATTGSWDRTGEMGSTGANAWTAMPGSAPYGAVLEESVATFGNIIAHELGHYLSLDHVNDRSDIMNPIIYNASTKITNAQCQAARATSKTVWRGMLR